MELVSGFPQFFQAFRNPVIHFHPQHPGDGIFRPVDFGGLYSGFPVNAHKFHKRPFQRRADEFSHIRQQGEAHDVKGMAQCPQNPAGGVDQGTVQIKYKLHVGYLVICPLLCLPQKECPVWRFHRSARPAGMR